MPHVPALSDLRPGQSAVITKLSGVRLFRRRLLELGLLPGTSIRVVNVAPLGDPLEIEVRGCRLSIRGNEAAQIAIEAPQPRRLRVVA